MKRVVRNGGAGTVPRALVRIEGLGTVPRTLVRVEGLGTDPWTFEEGTCWAAVGETADFCALLAGLPPPRGVTVDFAEGLEDRVQLVSFAQQSANVRKKDGWLQARYYSIASDFGAAEEVADFLSFEKCRDVNPFEVRTGVVAERRAYKRDFTRIVRLLNLTSLLGRPFHVLSNGETRRVLLARALLADPGLVVLQDPFAGLDPTRREQVKQIFDALVSRGLSLFIGVRHMDELPACVTHVLTLRKGRLVQQGPVPKIPGSVPMVPGSVPMVPGSVPMVPGSVPKIPGSVPAVPGSVPTAFVAHPVQVPSQGKPVIELRDIHISFGKRKLFDGLNWTVRAGEHWILAGPNGSGKTTLLSLICGDNPQAYANDVTVLGQKREVGVMLAKVRRRMGMVSPEQQAYLGQTADELLTVALAGNPSLLLLDEPCLNLEAKAAARLKRKVTAWLKAHPTCAAVCIAHRPEDVPAGFDRLLQLGAGEPSCKE